jgi:cysteinyl-tRNA synthetase
VKIYNTLTRSKEELASLTPGEIRMYSCGVTVYDLCHVGHARMMIVFDVISRYLRFAGHRVTFVRNFTDIDDKIIRRANEEGVAASVISERYIAAFREDIAALGALPPEIEPKATEHVPEMIALIERLIAGGYAYTVDGDVYFEIGRFSRYGRLSGKNLEELLVGARVDVDERKRDPRDFALWKSAKPGEPSWPSPWGPGRPGWHVECSAMAMKHLGATIDLHGGGDDLIFPHHECEIAQSEAVTGKPFARYWAHNAMMNMGAEKMSKSLGNTLWIREILKRHDADTLRLWLLGTHYRNPIEYAEERLVEAARALERLWGPVLDARKSAEWTTAAGGADGLALPSHLASFRDDFVAAMDDDFNTPQALGALFEMARALNRRDGASSDDFLRGARALATLLGALGLREPKAPGGELPRELNDRIVELIRARAAARAGRDWRRADELRAELASLDVTVKDTPHGTDWEWKGLRATERA